MRMMTLIAAVLLTLAFGTQTVLAENEFVGVDKCKICHKKKKDGDQYGKWKASEHAKAFKTLGTDKAKQAAKKAGVSGDPQSAKECLVCHAAPKYDSAGKERPASMFQKKFDIEDGVQCEVCHGAGDKYYKRKVMKAIDEEGGVAKSATAKKTGLLVPDEAACKQCHQAKRNIGGVDYVNPTFKGFNYAEMHKKVAHPRPK